MRRNNKSGKRARGKEGVESLAGQSSGAYAVGYGRPPVGSRFRSGTSGNPKGRKKGSKNIKTLIRQAMTETISVQEGSKNRRVSKIEGVVLRQLQTALKGNDRSAMAVIKMAMQLGFLEEPHSEPEGTTLSPADEQILQQLFRRDVKRR